MVVAGSDKSTCTVIKFHILSHWSFIILLILVVCIMGTHNPTMDF